MTSWSGSPTFSTKANTACRFSVGNLEAALWSYNRFNQAQGDRGILIAACLKRGSHSLKTLPEAGGLGLAAGQSATEFPFQLERQPVCGH